MPLDLPASAPSSLRTLFPVITVTFFGLLSLGLPLSALPLHLHEVLHCSSVVVGWVMAAESIVTLASRRFAGHCSDRRGPKFAMVLGLLVAALSGAAYVLASWRVPDARLALGLLLCGRIATGFGESLIFTSGGTWPIGLLGRAQTGRAMAWIGIAMFGGIAAGTALGAVLYPLGGLAAVGVATMAAPLIAAAVAWRAQAPAASGMVAWLPWRRLIEVVWRPGLVFALASTGYGVVTAFLLLAYAAHGWQGGGLALVLFCVGYVGSRFLFGHRTDQLRGRAVIALTLLVEVCGLLLLALAGSPWTAAIGAMLSGFGLSMAYPLLAVMVVHGVPERHLGAAVATYDACFDLSIMLATPLAGLLVARAGFHAAFLFSALLVLLALALVWRLPVASSAQAESHAVS